MAINLIQPISPWARVRTVRLQTRLPSRVSLRAKMPLQRTRGRRAHTLSEIRSLIAFEKLLAERCSMSNSHADELRKARAAFVEDRRSHIKEAVSLLPANRHAAFQEVREALDLQAEIEALDRAIRDEENLSDRPKGAA